MHFDITDAIRPGDLEKVIVPLMATLSHEGVETISSIVLVVSTSFMWSAGRQKVLHLLVGVEAKFGRLPVAAPPAATIACRTSACTFWKWRL